MRFFLFALVVANVVVLAWTQGLFGPSGMTSGAKRMAHQLNAEQILVVSRDVPPKSSQGGAAAKVAKPQAPLVVEEESEPSEPILEEDERASTQNSQSEASNSVVKPSEKEEQAKPVMVEAGPPKCWRLRDLTDAESERLQQRIVEQAKEIAMKRSAIAGRSSFWVFIPPLSSKQAAEDKVADLRTKGITDLYIIQESGPNQRAISLGVFSTREGAAMQVRQMRDRGIEAQMTERVEKPASVSVDLRGSQSEEAWVKRSLKDLGLSGKLGKCSVR